MLSWSRRRAEEPGHPDHVYIVAGVRYDETAPLGMAVAYAELDPVPYAKPEALQRGVIEPSAVYQRRVVKGDWTGINYTYVDVA